MAITVAITLKGGDVREVIVDPEEITLGFFEDLAAAQKDKDMLRIATLITDELGITAEERRQIRTGDFKRIAQALSGESEVPLESA